ncbi:MAG: hypothetical protein JWM99_698 [Verrucomicrobiales bacterium]|nr:hypothetical protein [Verrucomicrobiales bacterium]
MEDWERMVTGFSHKQISRPLALGRVIANQ